MTGTNNLNLGNLTDNPLYDFIKVLSSNSDNENSNDSFSFFESDDLDSPYNNGNFDSVYVDHVSVCNSRLNEKINIMSLNIQSLPAKFSELLYFINHCSQYNFLPDIILLQEIWQIADPNIFSLKNYQPLVYKCRDHKQGGGSGHLC
jgi:hypothetical protein